MWKILGQLDRTFHLRRTAGQDDPCGDQVLVTAASQLGLDQGEKLVITGFDHFGQSLSGEFPGWAVAHAGDLDGFSSAGQLSQGTSISNLDLLGILRRRAQRHRDVVGDLIAGDRNHRGVANRAFGEDGHVGSATADVDQADAQLLLVVG